MTHTNFKKIEGLPQQSKAGIRFIRSKGKIFTVDPNTKGDLQAHEQGDRAFPPANGLDKD